MQFPKYIYFFFKIFLQNSENNAVEKVKNTKEERAGERDYTKILLGHLCYMQNHISQLMKD